MVREDITAHAFVFPSSPCPQGSPDNVDGVLIVHLGDTFTSQSTQKRYRVHDLLGNGAYGQVYLVSCVETGTRYAMKVSINKFNYRLQAQNEVLIYTILSNQYSSRELSNLGGMVESFVYLNHIMIVLELYYTSLGNLLAARHYDGVPLDAVQMQIRGLATGLQRIHQLGLVHTDIKPDNICLTSDSVPKLIDFGGCQRPESLYHSYFQSRYYRAPEAILEMPITYKVDIWSLGCVAAELYLGIPIFPGNSKTQMLQLFEKRIGRFPVSVVRRVDSSDVHIGEDGVVITSQPFEDPSHFRTPNLADSIMALSFLPPDAPADQVDFEQQCLVSFVDLVFQMLKLDPDDRITIDGILNHNFMQIMF